MSSGKGGEQKTTVKLPPDIEAAAKDNLALAKQVGSLPYAPYFGGSVAAFAPGQTAGFNNMNEAAGAFGLLGGAGKGLPKPSNFGGVSAYSTEQPYKDAMGQVNPAVMELYNSFFYPHNTAAVNPATTPIAAKKAGVTAPPPASASTSPAAMGLKWNKTLNGGKGGWTRPATSRAFK